MCWLQFGFLALASFLRFLWLPEAVWQMLPPLSWCCGQVVISPLLGLGKEGSDEVQRTGEWQARAAELITVRHTSFSTLGGADEERGLTFAGPLPSLLPEARASVGLTDEPGLVV